MKDYKVHGVFSICNTGGIEVSIEDGIDTIIHWRFCVIDKEPAKWHSSKVYYTSDGRAYFRAYSMRVYLDCVERVAYA